MSPNTTIVHPWAAEAVSRIRFGIETVAFAPWPILRDFGQAVDDLGFDSLWLTDHPIVAGSATWTHLAALAEATKRVRLGPLVACASHLNPVILARAAADIDLISGGRAVLGIGSGNLPGEFAQLGIPSQTVKERNATLEAALQIVYPLLRGEPVTVAAGPYRPEGAALIPPPIQEPHIPILVGGGGEQTTLRLAAEYADASNLGAVSRARDMLAPDTVVRKFTVLDGHLAAAGRPNNAVLRTGLLAAFLSTDPASARVKRDALPPDMIALYEQLPFVETLEDLAQQTRAMLASGVRYVIFIVMPGDEETLRYLAERVLPAVM